MKQTYETKLNKTMKQLKLWSFTNFEIKRKKIYETKRRSKLYHHKEIYYIQVSPIYFLISFKHINLYRFANKQDFHGITNGSVNPAI